MLRGSGDVALRLFLSNTNWQIFAFCFSSGPSPRALRELSAGSLSFIALIP